MKAAESKHIPVTLAYAGLEFSFGPAACTIVSPPKEAEWDANNSSAVIFLDFDDTDFLFTGDMEALTERFVLEAGYTVDAKVLKAAHHGSKSSTSEAFLIGVSPEYVVISCGSDNRYGHTHDDTLELLDRYGIASLRTDLLGNIQFIADGQELVLTYGH